MYSENFLKISIKVFGNPFPLMFQTIFTQTALKGCSRDTQRALEFIFHIFEWQNIPQKMFCLNSIECRASQHWKNVPEEFRKLTLTSCLQRINKKGRLYLVSMYLVKYSLVLYAHQIFRILLTLYSSLYFKYSVRSWLHLWSS